MLCCLALVIGLFYSKAMMGIVIIVLAGNVVLHPNGIAHIKRVLQNRSWWIYWIVVAIYLVSLLYSADGSRAWFAIQMKLPFLFLPIVFYATPNVTHYDLKNVLVMFILTCVLVSTVSLIDLFQNQKELIESFKSGGSLNVPVQHPRFSLLVAVALLSSIYLVVQKHVVRFKWERILFGLCVLFFFLYLHILAVRSGLFSFYLAAIVWIIIAWFKNKRHPILIGLLIVVCIAPFAAYKSIPTFENKVDYMLYDMDMLLKKQHVDMPLSDSDRLVSMLAGIEGVKNHPWIGVGAGDMNRATQQVYQQHFPKRLDRVKLPHNQFIYVGVFAGLLGLIVFLFVMCFPFFKTSSYHQPFYLVILILMLSSFLVEATLETQLGTTIFTFFVFLSKRLSED